MTEKRDLILTTTDMYNTYINHLQMEGLPRSVTALLREDAWQIVEIIKNIWAEGEPGHEEYHIHPKAFKKIGE